MGAAWGNVLQVIDSNNVALLLERLAVVIGLPAAIRREAEQLDLEVAVLLKRLPDVERAFSNIHLGGQLADFIRPISEATLDNLEVCSSMLHSFRPEVVPGQDELQKLSDSLAELTVEVAESELDPDLRGFLLEHSHQMLRAVEEFRIAGSEPMKRAAQRAVGELVLRPELRKKAESSSAGKRFSDLLTKMLLLLTVVHTGFELAQPFVPALAPGEDKPPIVIVRDDPSSQAPSRP